MKQDRQANEILREVSAYFAQAPLAVWRQTATGQREFDRLFKLCPRLFVARQCMFTCTSGDDHRAIHGVESICRPLQITLSGYYARRAMRADPSKVSARQQQDAILRPKIKKVWNDNWQIYGGAKPGGSCAVNAKPLCPSRPIALQSPAGQRGQRGTPYDRHGPDGECKHSPDD